GQDGPLYVPVDKAIEGLVDNGSMPAPGRTDQVGLGNLLPGPLAGSPVTDLALPDEVVDGLDGLLQRGLGIVAVAVEDVHVLELQTFEAILQAVYYVFPAQALVSY